jgi:hypothetical protein
MRTILDPGFQHDRSGLKLAFDALNAMLKELYEGAGGLNVYEETIALGAGTTTDVTTEATTEPVSVLMLSSDDEIIDVSGGYFTVVGGVYVFHIYSTDALTGVKLKIIY